MKTRARGEEELAEFYLDIGAFERKSRKRISRSLTREAEDKRISSYKSYKDANTAFETVETSTREVTTARKGTNDSLDPPGYISRQNKIVDNRDNVHIGTFDKPGVRRENTGIVEPLVTNDSFKIKPSLIHSIQGSKYSGTKDENLLDHLYHFDRLFHV